MIAQVLTVHKYNIYLDKTKNDVKEFVYYNIFTYIDTSCSDNIIHFFIKKENEDFVLRLIGVRENDLDSLYKIEEFIKTNKLQWIENYESNLIKLKNSD